MATAERQPEAAGEAITVLFDAAAIQDRVAELAGAIAGELPRDLLVVSILKGSFVFAADLIRALHAARLSPEVDFMFLASYGDATVSSGEVVILRDIESDVTGRHVLLVDDILESGRTLAFAKALLRERGAARVATCVLLDKAVRRAAPVEADFVGFACPDIFVIGYGMDLANRYRELPYVGVLVGRGAG